MMIRSTTRRPGMSLMEVLVGFGILGIGVTSVITLFPFSALTLGQAMRDDRTVTCAVTADGQLREIHLRNVVEVEQNGGTSAEFYNSAMDNPGGGLPPLARNSSEPSYPVFVDPMGVAARPIATPGFGSPVGDGGATGIPRVNLKFISDSGANANSLALRYCSQMDGLLFDDNGQVPTAITADKRELRYNWLWVLQRPVNRDRYTVRMQVVVFDKRAHLYAPLGTEAVLTGVSFTPGTTIIGNVPAGAELRKGSWVLDAGSQAGNVANGVPVSRHAEFYRVLSVSPNPLNAAFVDLEVNKPVTRADGQGFPYTGTLVSIPGVADVFERPALTAGGAP